MNDYTTTTEAPTTAFDFSQWEVASSSPAQPETQYKTANPEMDPELGDFQEYKTKYHGYSLEKLEKMDKRRTTLEDFYEEDGILFLTPKSKRR